MHCSSSSTMNGQSLPQHLTIASMSRQRMVQNPLTWTGIAMAILSSAGPSCNALSVSSPSSTTAHTVQSAHSAQSARSLVDQARMLREMKIASDDLPKSKSQRRKLLASSEPALDNDAWMAALFDMETLEADASATSSIPSTLGASGSLDSFSSLNSMGSLEEKTRAEEYDRAMAEEVEVTSMIQDQIKPGSLVGDVKETKGADVDMEHFLQAEAMKRRAAASVSPISSSSSTAEPSMNQSVENDNEDNEAEPLEPPSIPTNPRTSTQSSKYSKAPLLTRDQEYTLARTIQRGVHLHKLKSEYESTHSRPPTKKQWAQLAHLDSPNELRRLVADYRTAKQELVSSNMGLVYAVVKEFKRKAKMRGVTEEELVQEGSLGLIRAAELFDPERGLRFSTYATIWIKGVLSNASLGEVIYLPARERTKWNKIRRAWNDLIAESGAASDSVEVTDKSSSSKSSSKTGSNGSKLDRKKTFKTPKKLTPSLPKAPSTTALSQQLKMKQSDLESTLQRMSQVRNPLSLDYQYSTRSRSGDSSGQSFSALNNDPSLATDADLFEKMQLHADVVTALVRNLNEKEVRLMRLRFGLHDGQERTLRECARVMGINRETARLLQKGCFAKLREARDAESLQEYLMTLG